MEDDKNKNDTNSNSINTNNTINTNKTDTKSNVNNNIINREIYKTINDDNRTKDDNIKKNEALEWENKRNRSAFSHTQVWHLEQLFTFKRYPSNQERSYISNLLELSGRGRSEGIFKYVFQDFNYNLMFSVNLRMSILIYLLKVLFKNGIMVY